MATKEQIKKLREIGLEGMMKPYIDGGTEKDPVVRTLGVVFYWLTVLKGFSPEIAGGAIFLVFLKIIEEGDFKGDSTYGSAGHELDQAILQVAQDMYNEKTMTGMYKKIATNRMPAMKRYQASVAFECQAWCFKMWSVKYWKFRALKRAEKKRKKEIKKKVELAWKAKMGEVIKDGVTQRS